MNLKLLSKMLKLSFFMIKINFKNMKMDTWDRLAKHTFTRCKNKCKTGLGSCCEETYCDTAAEYMIEKNKTPPEHAGGRVRFLTPEGQCVIPPRYRPMCTAHQCDIYAMGCTVDDPKWEKEYFRLRNKASKEEV